MKILSWGNNSGSQMWRLVDPFKYLNKMGHECYVTKKDIPTCDREGLLDWADIYIPQGCVDKEGLACLYMYQQEKGKKIVLDLDDSLTVTKDNPHYEEHKVSDAKVIIQKTAEIADLITTTQDYLADKLKKINPKVEVLPNYMDMDRWEFNYKPNTSGRIRIGYCASVTHWLDVKMIEQPLKRILREYKNIDLVMIGDMRYKTLFKEFNNVEVMLGLSFDAWPNKLNGLRLDIGLAPLRDTEFNRCKSGIKWAEGAINKIPMVVSPTIYSDISREFDGRLGMIANTPEEWYQSIKNLIDCKNLRDDISMAAYSFAKSHWDLSKNVYKWEQVYKRLFS